MIDPLIRFRSRLATQERNALDETHILTSVIRGFVFTETAPTASSPTRNIHDNIPSTLTLISRLSCKRVGTRFNSRGVDDDGHVANFVESETIYWHSSGLCFSYVQVRGSVPVFWEQSPGLLPGQQKIHITRSVEATQPAFDKHFEHLELKYGTVHILNLLSKSRPGEIDMTMRYKNHVVNSHLNQIIQFEESEGQRMLQQSQFDFHAEAKGPSGYAAGNMIRDLVQDHAEVFMFFLCDQLFPGKTDYNYEGGNLNVRPRLILRQEGVFRTNCLDCLDRTNLIQTILSQMQLEFFLRYQKDYASVDFWKNHSGLWADNGDVSRLKIRVVYPAYFA